MSRVWVTLVLTVVCAAAVTLVGVRSGGNAAPAAYLGSSRALETIKYYDVRGSSIEELRRDVFTRGPYDSSGRRFAGWAEWRIQWRFDRKEIPQGCAIANAVVEAHVNYTLPRWVDADDTPIELQDTWNRFLEALTLHEQGHGQLARELASEIEFAIKSLPPEPTCDELDRSVNVLANRMIREDKSQEAYDLATGHGRTQGAAFPTMIVRASATNAANQQ